ncbi:MAG: Uma2 family endonuclease [Acidimicrobiales bacterium]
MPTELARPPRAFVYEDLGGMPDDGYRREIIDGNLHVSPAPAGGHQRVSMVLATILFAAESPETLVLPAPCDWRLPDGGSVEPDVMVVRRGDFDPDGPVPATAVPVLVVEVVSPSSEVQDRAVKRELYERLGVPAYWIVDPKVLVLEALRLVDGRYQTEAEVAGGATFVTDWPFPMSVVPAELMG